MSLENIIKNSKSSRNKYDSLVKSLEYYIYEQKQENIKEVIGNLIDTDKEALSKRISIWKEQLNNVRNNDEYDYIEKRINIGEAVLNAL